MTECNSTSFLLCFTRLSPKYLEIISLIISTIGGILTFFGLSGIPFYVDSNIYKILFFINIPFFQIIIILNIIFLFFRYYDLINNKLNLWSYVLSIVEIYICLFGIVFCIINDCLIINNMKYYHEETKRKKSPKYPKITLKQWLYTEIILPIILFIWINLILIAISDNLLIYLKISGSYHKYELALEEEDNFNKNKDKDKENNNNKDNNNKMNETNIKLDKSMNNDYIINENKEKENDINNKDINKNKSDHIINTQENKRRSPSDLTDNLFKLHDDNNYNMKNNLNQNEEIKN